MTASTVGDLTHDNPGKDATRIDTTETSLEPEDVYYRFGGGGGCNS